MRAYTFVRPGKAAWTEKPMPDILSPRDAVVRVTMSSVCTSDLHILAGTVPRAAKGVTLGHEFVGVVEETGDGVTHVKAGDRVAVNVETFCGECFFCRRGYVNNCVSPEGGWALGCRIDGAQSEYVRVPFADTGLTKIPDNVTEKQALLAGDVLATGYWAADIADIEPGAEALVIGGGPVGICCALCARLNGAARVLVCEKEICRREFITRNYPELGVVAPEEAIGVVRGFAHGGADAVIEAAGTAEAFELAYTCARPNATVVVAAMYVQPLVLPLPDMYGKNLVFKTGGVDGHYVARELADIAAGRIDVSPLVTHEFPFSRLEEAYTFFASRADGVMKVGILM